MRMQAATNESICYGTLEINIPEAGNILARPITALLLAITSAYKSSCSVRLCQLRSWSTSASIQSDDSNQAARWIYLYTRDALSQLNRREIDMEEDSEFNIETLFGSK